MSVRIEIKDSTGRLDFDKFQDKAIWEADDLCNVLNEELKPILSGAPANYTSIEGYDGLTVAMFLGDPPQDADGDAFGKQEVKNRAEFLGDVVVLTVTSKESTLRLLDKIRERIAEASYTYEEPCEYRGDYWLAANTTSSNKDGEPDRSEIETERQTVA